MSTDSSSTFGTFLTTLGTLTSPRVAPARADDDIYQQLIGLIAIISRVGEPTAIASLARESDLPRSQLLKAIDQGKLKGLFDTVDVDGVSLLRLTTLGRAFVPSA